MWSEANPGKGMGGQPDVARVSDRLDGVEDSASTSVRQWKCASIAAREGMHEAACNLLKLSIEARTRKPEVQAAIDRSLKAAKSCIAIKKSQEAKGTDRPPVDEGWVESLGVSARAVDNGAPIEEWRLAAAHVLIQDELRTWRPRTFVHLAISSGNPLVLHACVAMACESLEVPTRDKVGAPVLALAHGTVSRRWRTGIVAAVYEDSVPEDRGSVSHGLIKSRREYKYFDVLVGKARVFKRVPSSCVFMRPSASGGLGALLREAAGANSVELVRALIDRGVSVYAADSVGSTALHFAARAGAEEVCRLLMAEGIDPFLDNTRQQSAYELSMSYSHEGVRRIFHPREPELTFMRETAETMAGTPLLRASLQDVTGTEEEAFKAVSAVLVGATEVDVNEGTGNEGITPLMMAAAKSQQTCVKALLNAKASIDLRSRNGCTALMFACRYADFPFTVSELIQRGASVNLFTLGEGASALIYAADGGLTEVVKVLLEGKADATRAISNGETALHMAAKGGQVEVVKMLIALPGVLQIIDRKSEDAGLTALMMASDYGQTATVAVLLTAKAQVNQQNKRGETSLYLACADGHDETVSELLRSDADHALPDHNGRTCLIVACNNSHVQTVQLLLAHGASVNAVDTEGTNALMATCLFDGAGDLDAQIIKLLILNKAHIDATTSNKGSRGGASALQIASENHHKLAFAALLNAGANANRPRNDGHTALSLACMNDFTDFLTLLLSKDVDMHAFLPILPSAGAAPEQLTPLMIAARYGASMVVRDLLDFGASVSIKNPAGHTALDMALQAKANGVEDAEKVVEVIRSYREVTIKRSNASVISELKQKASVLNSRRSAYSKSAEK